MSESSELERCIADPGRTPPQRALRELMLALGGLPEASAKVVERAIVRSGAAAVEALIVLLDAGDDELRPALLRLSERLANETQDARLFEPVVAALGDAQAVCRKLAARALGKLRDARAEPALVAALRRASVLERKSIVDALGAVGGVEGLAALAQPLEGDADLERRRTRARLLIERRLARDPATQIELASPLASRSRLELSCRSGLVEILRAELEPKFAVEVRSPTSVWLEHRGTLGELLVARTALEVAIVVPIVPIATGVDRESPVERIAETLGRPETLALFEAWTRGVPRFRVAWAGSGHRRALHWALGAALRKRTTRVVNDSRGALWTLRVAPDATGELRLVPRLEPDPRFAHRVGAVRAASHPTIAAALARIAGVEPDEVVWDPFVGSGLELCERARLGPMRALYGTDLDPAALAVARQNLTAAGVTDAQLLQADALGWAPADVSLILTNPPMGRRLARDGSLEALLEAFVKHAGRALRPGGRLVWLSPLPAKTERWARAQGLAISSGPDVDLGGFSARVQVLRRTLP